MRGGAALIGLVLALAALAAAPSAAQLSPGPLAASHAELEGNRACLSCHRAGKGVDAALCLDCHRALGARLAAGQGLHARSDHQRCERCHSEHNGRDFALVRWPEGEKSFDHATAGWPLVGKHAAAACRDCHKAAFVSPELLAAEPKKDPARSFLGLSTACAACHADPHQGSLAPAACTDCHSQETWKGAAGFDHARTRYALSGAHAKTPCLDCHKQPAAAASGAKTLLLAQFKERALPACAECHVDIHRGKLGTDCASCHTTATFRTGDNRRFDHERTAYPLRGRHRTVECARCHTAGRELRIPGFERCETCHRDAHAGQLLTLSARPGRTACADCHAVEGFLPARYAAEEHARSRFPLAGAHLAIPCTGCHREVASAVLPAPFQRASPPATRQYRFAATACRDCHEDPHAGSLDRYAGGQGCAACHGETTWREVKIDHATTRYPLAGRHATTACVACHPRAADGRLALAPRPLDCAGCHRDVHAGQLARAGVTACERCHSTDGFRPAPGFAHQRDSRYALDGRHVNLPCAACHHLERQGDDQVIRFKPLPVECAGCHGQSGRPASRG